MKTVKTIVNIIVVILLLPFFASATTGVAIVNTVKGETFSLSFVEKSVLTTINIAKSVLNLLVQMAYNATSLIFLGIALVSSFVKQLLKPIAKIAAKTLMTSKSLLWNVVKKAKSLFTSSKEKVFNASNKMYAFRLSIFTSIMTVISISNLKAKWLEHKNRRVTESEHTENEANDVCINLELELTEELVQLLNLDSEAPTLKASLTISKEIALNVFKSLLSTQMITA